MKLKSLLTISAFTAIGLISSAQASDFNYNYVEGSYSALNDEFIDGAFNVKGSYDITENINIIGGYTKYNIPDDINGDADNYKIGIGYHTPITEKTDLVTDISYQAVNVEDNDTGESLEASGVGVKLGVRHKFSDSIEANASLEHVKLDEDEYDMSGTGTTIDLGGRYHINEAMSAGLNFSTGTEDGSPESLTSSLRWNFL